MHSFIKIIIKKIIISPSTPFYSVRDLIKPYVKKLPLPCPKEAMKKLSVKGKNKVLEYWKANKTRKSRKRKRRDRDSSKKGTSKKRKGIFSNLINVQTPVFLLLIHQLNPRPPPPPPQHRHRPRHHQQKHHHIHVLAVLLILPQILNRIPMAGESRQNGNGGKPGWKRGFMR